MYRIRNHSNGIMRVAWVDPKDPNKLIEENKWETLEKAEEALLLLKEYAIAGDLDQIKGLRIINEPDS
jgi:hypothetical protein